MVTTPGCDLDETSQYEAGLIRSSWLSSAQTLLPRLIADLSAGMTLEAGDILSTGTPEGVGFARTPPEFMKPGDLLETEIRGIGVLRNPIG